MPTQSIKNPNRHDKLDLALNYTLFEVNDIFDFTFGFEQKDKIFTSKIFVSTLLNNTKFMIGLNDINHSSKLVEIPT